MTRVGSCLPTKLGRGRFCRRAGSNGTANELQSVGLVIFDCDGVIADSEVLSARVLVRELMAYDIRIDAEYVYRNFVGKSFPVVADIIAERFEAALPDTFVSDYRAALREAFAESLDTTPGFLDMLGQLTCPACVATSSSAPRAANTLGVLGLAEHFGADVFTASQVAQGKPAPDLFLFASRAMSTPPRRCMELSEQLSERFGLRSCEIVPSDPGAPESIKGVAIAGAGEMRKHLDTKAPRVVAVGTGRVLRACVE